MSGFRFPLQRVLDLRRMQLELEQARFRQQAAAVGALDRARADMEAGAIRAEVEVRQRGYVPGNELGALQGFRLRVKSEQARIAQQRETAARELAAQQETMLQAQRRAKLLERLRERREQEWEAARNKELDEIAGESFLAQWSRRASG